MPRRRTLPGSAKMGPRPGEPCAEASMVSQRATARNLVPLFVPMALSSWLGWLVPPLVNAAVARASDSYEAALASFAVARNLTMLLSPFSVMVPTAVLVLVTGAASRRRVRNFLAMLCAGLAAVTLLLLLTSLRHPFLEGLLGLEPRLAERTRLALLVLVLHPPMSIWRGFSQGLLIRSRRTAAMVWAGAVGFLASVLGVALGRRLPGLPGEVYGALVLLVSTLADAAALQVTAARASSGDPPPGGDAAAPSHGAILRYFLPLLLTTWVMAASRTVIDAGLARTPQPATALAAFSLAASFVFAFEAPIVMLRSAALAFEHDPDNRRRLRLFCIAVGAAMTAGAAVGGSTPLVDLLLGSSAASGGAVGDLTRWGIRIMAVSLLILSWRQFSYSLLMKRQRTDIVAASAVARMLFLALAVFAGFRVWPDMRLAAAAYTLGFLLESLVCDFGARRIGAA